MSNNIKILSIFCILSLAIDAMEPEASFKVAVRNNFGAPIDVTYTINGKTVVKKLGAGADILGTINKMDGQIVISRSGAYMGYTAKSWSLPKNGLLQLWAQKEKYSSDVNTLLLIVESTAGGAAIAVRYVVVPEESIGVSEKLEKDVLDQFSMLEHYGLNKKLTPEQVIAIRSPKEVVIKAGWLSGATTGEDIARYILGLDKNYDRASLDRAYRELALQWAPDKQTLPAMKEFAGKVMPIINHARDLLTQALRDKGQ